MKIKNLLYSVLFGFSLLSMPLLGYDINNYASEKTETHKSQQNSFEQFRLQIEKLTPQQKKELLQRLRKERDESTGKKRDYYNQLIGILDASLNK